VSTATSVKLGVRARLRAPVVVGAQLAADPREVAEALGGGAPRLGRGHAARRVVALAHLEVEAQLVVDVRVDVRPPEAEIAPPHRPVTHQASRGSARSTRVTGVA
jgi:hypothetical protein